MNTFYCQTCKSKDWSERKSLGIYAGRYCDKCWSVAPYIKEPAASFNPADAGESYEQDQPEIDYSNFHQEYE